MTKSYCDAYNAGFEKGYAKAKKELEKRVLIDSSGDIHPIDTKPQRKMGKWLVDEDGNMECPFCGNTCGFGNYCNECGADMRGESDV